MTPLADYIELFVDYNSRGERLLESVPAAALGADRYEVRGSPALALGVAAGDTISLEPDGGYKVIQRGGNLAVQVFAPEPFDPELLGELITSVESLGGYLDGGNDSVRVFTVPVAAGFPKIEAPFLDFERRHARAEWLFGNVYADDGITPLDWWN